MTYLAFHPNKSYRGPHAPLPPEGARPVPEFLLVVCTRPIRQPPPAGRFRMGHLLARPRDQ
jgi:hypothetical protein